MKSHNTIPPHVLQALETLERANAPAELGHPYQVLLEWRRQHPATVLASNILLPGLTIAVLGAIALLLSFVSVPDSEYWRGAQLGFSAALFIVIIRDLIFRHAPPLPPESIERRIEAAVDRWRHAVPAMRDLPR